MLKLLISPKIWLQAVDQHQGRRQSADQNDEDNWNVVWIFLDLEQAVPVSSVQVKAGYHGDVEKYFHVQAEQTIKVQIASNLFVSPFEKMARVPEGIQNAVYQDQQDVESDQPFRETDVFEEQGRLHTNHFKI